MRICKMTSLVTLQLFSAFKGEYPFSCPTSIIKYRMQTAFQNKAKKKKKQKKKKKKKKKNILFSLAFIRRYMEMD